MQRVDVFLTGQLSREAEARSSAVRLAALAAIDEALALRLLQAGQPVRIKKDVTAQDGQRYQRALQAIGVAVALRAAVSASEVSSAAPAFDQDVRKNAEEQALPPIVLGPCAKTVPLLGPRPPALAPPPATSLPLSRTLPRARFMQANLPMHAPVRPPSRGLAVPVSQGPRSRRTQEWLGTPRVVPALQGWEWLRQSWQMFAEQPAQWLGLFSAACGLLILLFLTPDAHFFLLLMTLPVVLGTLVAAAHRQNLEEPPHPLQSLLLAGKNWKALVLFGLFSLLFLLFLGTTFFFLAGFGIFGGGGLPADAHPRSVEPLVLMGLGLLSGVVLIPVLSGYLLTIPLVVLADCRPLRAYRLGVYGCVKNWKALMVAATTSIPVLLLAAALLSGAWLVLPWPWLTLLFPALVLPAAELGILLAYNAFRDIFASIP